MGVARRVCRVDDGAIRGYEVKLASRCGYSADLSAAINDRAMYHADNAYYLPAATIVSHRMKTHTVSNTAFRGFGGPQGIMAIERVIDAIAWPLNLDPLDVRKRNLYSGADRDMTPYGMRVTDNVLPALIESLEKTSDYRSRRAAVAAFNAGSRFLKRGIALTPVKFGISFTNIMLNQAGALVHIYHDGTVHLNHGGIEMGQGLFTKVAQVVAEESGIDLDRVRIPRAVHLQDSVLIRRAGRLACCPVRQRQPRGDDLPLESGRRAAPDAGDFRVCGNRRRPAQPRAGQTRSAGRTGNRRVDRSS